MLNPVAPERELQVAGSTVLIRRQGIGVPVLVAPSDIGSPGWSEFHEALSQSHDVIAVDLPGFNALHSAEWIRHPRDLAALLGLTLDKLGVGEALVVGVGFGGWLAAELATFAQGRLAGLVLVNPMGLKPREGEIFDQFLVGHEDYVRRGFQDADRFTALYGASADIEQLIKWDHAREMTSRAWSHLIS